MAEGTASCRCGATWGGLRTAHCAAEKSAMIPLAVWDGDPCLLAQRYTELYQAPIDAGGVAVQALADLASAEPFNVQRLRFPMPWLDDGDALVVRRSSGTTNHAFMVQRSMFSSGKWSQVLWTIVGPVMIQVVNVIFGRDIAVDHPVLVGLDVLLDADFPAESDVSVGGGVSTRLVIRNLLARGEEADGDPIPGLAAGGAESLLSRAGDEGSAHGTRLDHELMLQVKALCHRTFSGVSNFDEHRPGECRDPADCGMVILRISGTSEIWGHTSTDEWWKTRGDDDDDLR